MAALKRIQILLCLFILSALANQVRGFQVVQPSASCFCCSRCCDFPLRLSSKKRQEDESSGGSGSPVEEYRNVVTQILSNFMSNGSGGGGGEKPKTKKENNTTDHSIFDNIDFDAPKLDKKLDLETFAKVLDAELYEKEWFVTGNVNPIYFSPNFVFQDPDVTLKGIEAYAKGVYKLFDQETSRAEIISTRPNAENNTITCTWRLSGYANIGPGLRIKPYIVYTDFRVDPETGLIEFQEDRFDIPSWDILLSAFFPFLIGKITSPPAPPVEPRKVVMPKF